MPNKRSEERKPGEALHRLVTAIERATQHDKNVTVESPKRMVDADTGNLREHDVVLTVKEAHHTVVVAIECRDRSRKVGVPEIEAFHSKCQKTGVDRGVIVSSKGFARSALKKAKKVNLGCLTLDQAAGFDWCLARGIEVLNRKLTHVSVRVITKEPLDAGFVLCKDSVGALESQHLKNMGVNCLNTVPQTQLPPSLTQISPDQIFGHRCIDRSGTFYVREPSGAERRIDEIWLDCHYRVESTLVPFEFHTYSDAGSAENLYNVVTAPVKLGAADGRIMMVQKPGEPTTVTLITEGAKEK